MITTTVFLLFFMNGVGGGEDVRINWIPLTNMTQCQIMKKQIDTVKENNMYIKPYHDFDTLCVGSSEPK